MNHKSRLSRFRSGRWAPVKVVKIVATVSVELSNTSAVLGKGVRLGAIGRIAVRRAAELFFGGPGLKKSDDGGHPPTRGVA
jgi:hypothetical protein